MALVVEAALQGDVGDQLVRRLQEPPRGVEPHAQKVLAGGDLEEAGERALEGALRHAGPAGERVERKGLGVAAVDFVRNGAQGVVVARLGGVAARQAVGAGGADDAAAPVAEGVDVRDHQAVRVVGGMGGDALEDGAARCKDFAVERHVVVGERRREEVARREADRVPLAADIADFAVAAVEGHDAARAVLHVEAQLACVFEQAPEGGGVRPDPGEEGRAQALLLLEGHGRWSLRMGRMGRLYIFFARLCKSPVEAYAIISTS